MVELLQQTPPTTVLCRAGTALLLEYLSELCHQVFSDLAECSNSIAPVPSSDSKLSEVIVTTVPAGDIYIYIFFFVAVRPFWYIISGAGVVSGTLHPAV